MRVLVVTTVHHPDDSRIRARQIAAMLAAGWEVTYAAPYLGYGLPLPAVRGPAADRPTSLARSAPGQSRPGGPSRAPHRGPEARRRPAARPGATHRRSRAERGTRGVGHARGHGSLGGPQGVAPAGAAHGWQRWSAALEHWAEDHVEILLAEPTYQERFRKPHAAVPNGVRVPATVSAPGETTVVHIGGLTEARGARELVALGRALAERTGGRVRLHLVGAAEPCLEPLVREARDNEVADVGRLPALLAGARWLDGALAGLSLLHDEPNYRISMPTKVLEYMAYGVPVIATPLPLAERLLSRHGAGIVVPFDDVRRSPGRCSGSPRTPTAHPDGGTRPRGRRPVRLARSWRGLPCRAQADRPGRLGTGLIRDRHPALATLRTYRQSICRSRSSRHIESRYEGAGR